MASSAVVLVAGAVISVLLARLSFSQGMNRSAGKAYQYELSTKKSPVSFRSGFAGLVIMLLSVMFFAVARHRGMDEDARDPALEGLLLRLPWELFLLLGGQDCMAHAMQVGIIFYRSV